MSFAEYIVNSIVGILVVFFALVLLMIIIKIITAVTDGIEKKKTKVEDQTKEENPIAIEYAEGTAGELKLYDTDERDAAMIMAIVADELKTPINELRFISIREVK